MSRRLMLRNASGGGILPPEYQQVEWIGISANGPYIATNYIPVQNDVLKCRFMALSSDVFTLLSAGTGSYQFVYLPDAAGIRSFIKYFQSGNAPEITFYRDILYDLTMQSPTSTLRGVVSGNTWSANTPFMHSLDGNATNLWLFRRRNGNDGGASRIYNFEILNGENTKLQLIPCYRKSDSEIGMYDTVSGTFYTNAGSSTFVKGDDV